MWSDDIDKKIQDAAGNFQPPFQEENWNRMNVLLDKHLPQEKKKRPFLLGLLLALLIGLPATVMLTTYKGLPDTSAIAQKTSETSTTTGTTAKGQAPPAKTSLGSPALNEHLISSDQSATPTENSPGKDIPQQKNSRVTTIITDKPVKKKNQRTSVPGYSTSDDASGNPLSTPQQAIPTAKNDSGKSTENSISSDDTNGNSSIGATTITSADTSVADSASSIETKAKDSLPAEPVTKKDKTPGARKAGKWQINLSAGPDLSMIGTEKTGKWKMQYGVGVSYAFSNRFQVRTGFMVSRKLYYADSSDYHPPKGFWSYYPNLQKIDANCLVYEIPLNVVYTFPSKKKHSWFVSTGVSSYLMKEETYEYYFKDTWGQPQYRERSVRNENDHFFSILQLSGGYQYKFSDKLSLMAEPYVKLPLGGVGFGKVKLNNTGMLFTLGYKPFVKRK